MDLIFSWSFVLGIILQMFMGDLMLYRHGVAGYINDLNRGVETMDWSLVRVRNGLVVEVIISFGDYHKIC